MQYKWPYPTHQWALSNTPYLHKPVCPSQLALTPLDGNAITTLLSNWQRGVTQKEVGGSVAVLPKREKGSLEDWRIDISAQGQPQKRVGSNNSNSWEMGTRKTLTPRFY